MTHPGTVFRRLHEGPGAFVMPNPWDVGTARILAGLGFKALATTSAGMAFAQGLRDGQVSFDAMLDHCRTLVAATGLPVSGDLEKGLGDSPESAAETIRAAAAAGLAGCSLEDHTGDPGQPIYPFELAVERIAAAVEAKQALGHDFVLTARAENLLWGRPDLDDTIRRLQAFEHAGADVLYAPGLRDLATIRTVCAAVNRPVNVLMGLRNLPFGQAELAEAGVRRISIGSGLARLAYGAFVDAARALHATGRFEVDSDAKGFGEVQDFLGKSPDPG